MSLTIQQQAQKLVDNGTYPDLPTAIRQLQDQGFDESSSPGGGSSSDPLVYWGKTTALTGSRSTDESPTLNRYKTGRGTPDTTVVDNMIPSSQAMSWLQDQFNSQTPTYKKIRQEMIDAGMIGPTDGIDVMLSRWNGLITLASNNKPGTNMSPLDYLSNWNAMNGISGKQGGSKTTTSDRSDTRYSTQSSVAGAYQNVAQQELGRRATGPETQAAYSVVHALQNSPSTEHAVTVTDAQGNSHITSSGTDAPDSNAVNEALTQQAMTSKDYGAYQAAGHYFPALISALSAVNQAGA